MMVSEHYEPRWKSGSLSTWLQVTTVSPKSIQWFPNGFCWWSLITNKQSFPNHIVISKSPLLKSCTNVRGTEPWIASLQSLSILVFQFRVGTFCTSFSPLLTFVHLKHTHLCSLIFSSHIFEVFTYDKWTLGGWLTCTKLKSGSHSFQILRTTRSYRHAFTIDSRS